MATRELNYTYEEFSSSEIPDPQIYEMIELAKRAADKAYAPYSKFKVGAAALLGNGEFISANNQENAAYPSGMCAERSLLYYANGNFPGVPIKRMVLVAADDGKLTSQPVYPCGACRQVMIQTQDRFGVAMEVWMIGQEKTHMVKSVDPLLPLKFSF